MIRLNPLNAKSRGLSAGARRLIAEYHAAGKTDTKFIDCAPTFEDIIEICRPVSLTPPLREGVHACRRCGAPNPERMELDGCRDPNCPEKS